VKVFAYLLISLTSIHALHAACLEKSKETPDYDAAISAALEWGIPVDSTVFDSTTTPLTEEQKQEQNKTVREGFTQTRLQAITEQKREREARQQREQQKLENEQKFNQEREEALQRSKELELQLADLKNMQSTPASQNLSLVAAPTDQAIAARAAARNAAALLRQGYHPQQFVAGPGYEGQAAVIEIKTEQTIILDNPSQQHLDFYAIIAALRHQPQHPVDKAQPIQQQDTADKALIDLIGEYTAEQHLLEYHRLLTILSNNQLLIQSTDKSEDGTLKLAIYDLQQKNEVAQIPISTSAPAQALLLSNGRIIILCMPGKLYLMHATTNQIISEASTVDCPIHKLYELPNEKILIIAGAKDHRIIRIQSLHGSTIGTLFGIAHSTQTIPVFENGDFIAPTDDCCLDLYNSNGTRVQENLKFPRTAEQKIDSERYGYHLPNLSRHSNGDIVGSLTCSPIIYLWNAQTGELMHTMHHADQTCFILCLENLSHNKLISADDNRNIKIWNSNTGKLIKYYQKYRFSEPPLTIATTSNYLIISDDNSIYIIMDPTLEKCLA